MSVKKIIEETEKLEFYLRDAPGRALIIENASKAFTGLSLEEEWYITAEVYSETRRNKQNRLAFRWWGDISRRQGVHIKYVHGWMKLELLLPMKISNVSMSNRGLFEKSIVDRIPDRDHRIAVAYDFVRSRDIPVRLFADWLTECQNYWGAQGIVLESRSDEEREAMMRGQDGN